MAREAATGTRARKVLAGDLGPVLKRWVTATVLPVSGRLREMARSIQAGDLVGAASLAQSPLFGLPDLTDSPALGTVLAWALKPGHLDEMVLTVMGEVISTLATTGKPVPLTRILTKAGGSVRELGVGQFLTQVQGAKAMLKVRRKGTPQWKQRKSLDGIATLMAGQVRSGVSQKEELGELPVRGRHVLMVRTPAGEMRRLDLRPPEEGDWEFLDVARHVKGEKDPHVGTWASFVMLVLCCAQAEAGWFDLTKITKRSTGMRVNKAHRGAHGLVLSDLAHGHIKKDLDKWMRLGFVKEPMLVPPVDGDYLTVKHRTVAGGRGPMGIRTEANGTTAWDVASRVMGGTAWTVPAGTLSFLRSDLGRSLAEAGEPDELRRETILGAHRRLAAEDAFYIPLFADFRGRVYARGNGVTYQGRDLQKSLLVFPPNPSSGGLWEEADRAIIRHAANLFGNGVDKAGFAEKVAWWNSLHDAKEDAHARRWDSSWLDAVLTQADEPLQLLTVLTLADTPDWDRIACQIDGTCNGLQHLSAMFRDETAAPYVNLTRGTTRQDIYGEVARRVSERLGTLRGDPWASRLLGAVTLDRHLFKSPVMVLPYGGTRVTIEDAIYEGVLKQEPEPAAWRLGRCLKDDGEGWSYWPDWQAGDYAAFTARDLKDHPLFQLDCRRLGGLTWDVITEMLPKAIQAMQAFRDIAKAVGSRTLEWSTGVGENPLWVVQAKAKSDRTPLHLKGLHLPGSVRGLAIRPGRDEIDPHAHVTGIVPNFVHSQDAAHQTRVMQHMGSLSGPMAFGAIFDCYITRPSLMNTLQAATRGAFHTHYLEDPLSHPVRIAFPGAGGATQTFASWYDLAEHCGVSFPERGTWDPEEVLFSEWFFS